jgi:DNA-binding MarR family transcriptional regulator
VPDRLSDEDFERLLEFRVALRRFLRWSEEEAAAVGLTPAQHQLLLAVRGTRDRRGPTVGDVAELLLLRHHSAVGLVDRAEEAGLVTRRTDPDDHRIVRVGLTALGSRRLGRLTSRHLEELGRLRSRLHPVWSALASEYPARDDPRGDA